MRLLLLAPPGAGKGTQAARLAQYYGIANISTGELLRREVAGGTTLGRQAERYLDRGDLVPDELMLDMVIEAVTEADRTGGFVLDGYPRNLAQAEAAQQLAHTHGIGIDGAVLLEVGQDELLRRLLRRGDAAGATSRSDDNIETIRHRLEVFESQTRPLVPFFAARGLLIPIDGEQPVEQVTQDIVDRLAGRAARPSRSPDPRSPDSGSR